jgi:hypothetical protein
VSYLSECPAYRTRIATQFVGDAVMNATELGLNAMGVSDLMKQRVYLSRLLLQRLPKSKNRQVWLLKVSNIEDVQDVGKL